MGLACFLSPPQVHAGPPPATPTVTELTVVNSQAQHITSVNYTSLPPANLITLVATVKTTIGAPIVNGTVVFCDGSGTVAHCLNGHSIGSAVITPNQSLLSVVATFTFAPTFGTHTYRAVYTGLDNYAGPPPPPNGPLAPSTSAAVTLQVVGPPPPGPTSTTITSSGNPGNYTLSAAINGIAAQNGFGAGPGQPITGPVSFQDTTNGNFLLGTGAPGASTYSSSFVLPAVSLPPAPPQFSVVLGAAANVKTGINNNGITPIFNDGSPDLVFLAPNIPGFFPGNPPGNYVIVAYLNQLKFGAATFAGSYNSVGMPLVTPMPPSISPLTSPLAMVTGDFNNDGNTDVVISFDDGSVYFIPGSGFGVFGSGPNNAQTVRLQPSGFPIITSMFVSDLARSGYKGIVGVSPLGLALITGGPTGLQPNIAYLNLYTSWDWTSAVAMGNFTDLQNDVNEIVVTNPDSQSITVFLGDGLGHFGGPANYTVGNGPSAIAIADFNGDGHLDLAVANSTDNTVTILLGDGTGNLSVFSTLPVGTDPTSLAVGDFNGDGIPDLAVGNAGDGTITVLLGNGDANFTESLASPLPSTLNTDLQLGVLAADFNLDRVTDIAAVNSAFPGVFIGQLTATASASLTGVAVAGTGTHQVNASYGGNKYYQPSTSGTAALTAAPLTTTLTLTALPSPGTWSQSVTLTATLSPYAAQGHTTNGETVKFYDGVTLLGPGTLASGVATFSTSTLSVGNHSLKAVYGGDTDFASSTGLLPFTVNKTTSTTTLAAASNHPVVGSVDLLTATVTGFSAPRGNVDFKQNGTTVCSSPLNAAGHATCAWVPWTNSTVHLVASYEGDGNHLGSTSNTLNFTPTVVFNSNVVLTVDNTQLTYPGQTQTVTCIHHSGNTTPTGTVQIVDDTTVIQTLSVGGDGCAYWYINPGLHAGPQYLRAHYSGDSNNAGGYSAITLVNVAKLATYWSVQCPQNISHGQNETCSIAIWSNLGGPPGDILYSYDNGLTHSVPIAGGNATIVIVDPTVGNHSIVVSYPGTNDLAPIGPQSENFTVGH